MEQTDSASRRRDEERRRSRRSGESWRRSRRGGESRRDSPACSEYGESVSEESRESSPLPSRMLGTRIRRPEKNGSSADRDEVRVGTGHVVNQPSHSAAHCGKRGAVGQLGTSCDRGRA